MFIAGGPAFLERYKAESISLPGRGQEKVVTQERARQEPYSRSSFTVAWPREGFCRERTSGATFQSQRDIDLIPEGPQPALHDPADCAPVPRRPAGRGRCSHWLDRGPRIRTH